MPTTTLTDVIVKRVRPPSTGQVEHWDALVRGFGLRVTVKGRKTWVLWKRLRNGKAVRHTLGKYPDISLAGARDLARAALLLIAEGKNPTDERKRDEERKRAERERPDSFSAVAAAFQANDRKAGPGWAKERARVIKRELVPAWGDLPIASITRADVIALLDSIAARGAPIQANRTKAIIGRLFTWAAPRFDLPGSPCVGIEKPGGDETKRKRSRVLSPAELRALWLAWDARGGMFGTFGKMLMLTAQRRGEVAGMRWADVHLDDGLWTIPLAKGGHAHEVPLAPAAVDLLRTLPRQHGVDYVFSTRRAKPIGGFGKFKDKTTEVADVHAWRFHDLRRTAATMMADKGGISKETIRRVLGHSESDVTETYVRWGWLREKRAALETWATIVATVVREPSKRGARRDRARSKITGNVGQSRISVENS